LKIGHFDIDQRPLVIAEIGNNHEGNFDLAVKMIELAAEAGADAVKFQTFRTEQYVSPQNRERFDRLKSFELTEPQFRLLGERAQEKGLLFLSTPFDLQSADLVGEICPAIKISSGDIDFVPLLKQIAGYGKPVILSSGGGDLRRIQHAKSVIEQVWAVRDIDPLLVVLHCISAYPAPPEEANLSAITCLQSSLQCPIGYSDHTNGVEAAAAAVALGACVIEKHFTVDKSFSDFRDHQLSADPPEFAEMVRRIRVVDTLLGSGSKVVQPSERPVVSAVTRSIVASRQLKEGKVIVWEDLNWVRVQGGLCPGRETELLGHSVKSDISEGEPLHLGLLSPV
jgi:sialic acid synthase SpsE